MNIQFEGKIKMEKLIGTLALFQLLQFLTQEKGFTITKVKSDEIKLTKNILPVAGEQQILAIGRGLMANPKLLLLDEPSVGLAPLIVKEIFDILVSLKKCGTTILMVEQNARAALKVADRAYILERGVISMAGKAKDMLQDTRVQSAYLGAKLHA